MIERLARGKSRRPALLAVVAVMIAVLLGAGMLASSGSHAVGMMQSREGGSPAAATPIVSEPDPGDSGDDDPLDGDPLDGNRLVEDEEAPADHDRIEIVRSGRPSQEPDTIPAYDDDPETVWTPEADSGESWLWLDLGEERRVREVRWLAQGTGAIDVAVSTDRRRWQDVDRVDVDSDWQGVTLRDDARYVRLEILRDDDGDLPAIAEVDVYGSDRGRSVSSEQEAEDEPRERRRDRAPREEGDSAPERSGQSTGTSGRDSADRQSDIRSSGRVRISAQPGETRCSGDRERCEARPGAISVEEDCEQEGTCTIDVRADGGTAICDASGGSESRAGRGEGRRGGDGGSCEAVANGGAVAIGDINP